MLALRAGETGVTAHSSAPPPVVVSPRPADGTLLATLAALQQSAPPTTSSATPTQEATVKENFGKLPLYFEQNVGQTDAAVHFFTRGPGYDLYLTSTEAVMVLQQPTSNDPVGRAGDVSPPSARPTSGASLLRGADAPRSPEEPPAIVRMQLVGANAAPAVTGLEEQPGKVNYFLGNDPAQWHTNVATFGRVEYDEVYPGIDLVWYGSNQQLEYDFVVSPGADPSVIRVNVSGAERLEIDAAGDLLIHTGEPGGVSPGSTLRQHKPFVYQTVGNTRQEVASRFVLEKASGGRESPEVRFAVGAYDAGLPLVIDPVLSYSTYLGGSNSDSGYGIAVDPVTGDTLVTGNTRSTNFPTANPLQASNQGGLDVFVTRLNAAGSALVFSTYLGGSGADYPSAIAVDPASGDALLTGFTSSTNFPTANPLQAANGGGADVFVTRLNAAGSALVYATYLGGSNHDQGRGLAVDPTSGDALLTGTTSSTNFPTANPLQGTCGGCPNYADAFVARLNAAGSALVWSTYLGGSDYDQGRGLAVDPASGDALVTGFTSSTNFPTANPLQATNRGFQDVFVARLNAAGTALVYSTYLGGNGWDYATGLAVDPASGDALLTGYTESSNFPTANPLQGVNRGLSDGFVARLSAAGSALVYSTYLGGSSNDWGRGLAVDPASGDALLTGSTYSTNFPTTPGAFDRTCGTDGNCDGIYDPKTKTWAYFSDAFVTRIGVPPAAYYYIYPDGGQVQAGVPFDLYVFALDAQFHVIPDYTGLILFYATDPQAVTPGYYQYQRPNPGYAYFAGGLTFNTPGFQELYVFDWPGVQVFGYAAFQVV